VEPRLRLVVQPLVGVGLAMAALRDWSTRRMVVRAWRMQARVTQVSETEQHYTLAVIT
jgi:hypothetical protein